MMAKTISHSKLNPFNRPKSSYRIIWNCLYHHRKKGISKERLIEIVGEQLRLNKIKKSEQCIKWSISVVSSSRQDKLSHPSIRKQSDFYYCDVLNGFYRLHLKK